MNSKERRAKEREDIRRAILDAAKELLATGDYEKVSMRRIAEKISYSPTAIYLHFKDKSEMMDALSFEAFALLAENLEAAQADDPIERLRRMSHAYVEFALTNRAAYGVMFLFGGHPQDLYEGNNRHRIASTRAFDALVNAVREIKQIENCEALEDPDTATLAAGVYWAHIHGAVALILMGRGREFQNVQEQLYHQTIETALAGLIALAKTKNRETKG